jgi:tRNA-(ms[2]io[6]A)-hydroxylase
VQALTALAREELDHFSRVVAFIEKRGLSLGAPPIDDYAAALRRAQTRLPASSLPLVVDRLLFSALIEARSCERFKLLIEALPSDVPADLRAFYEELFACEARHYRQYVDLAVMAVGIEGAKGRADVEARLELLAEAEANIVHALALRETRASVHG